VPATVNFLHCIAAGVEASDGYVWVTDGPPGGVVHKIDEETMLVEESYTLTDEMTLLYGISIDFEGNVWATSRAEDLVYKLDPAAETFTSVPVGVGPEPYSDMTGVQYKEAVIIE
jgi:streptogramin lyase